MSAEAVTREIGFFICAFVAGWVLCLVHTKGKMEGKEIKEKKLDNTIVDAGIPEKTRDSLNIDIDKLIATESGGDPLAVGDFGKSKGLGQIGKLAWKDALDYAGIGEREMPYDDYVFKPEANRAIMNIYINHVIPFRYFKTWGITDSIGARLAAYKCGPQSFKAYYERGRGSWLSHVPRTVVRDINKYYEKS